MFHDLVLALLGYSGDDFVYENRRFKVGGGKTLPPLIHPSELQVLEDILEIAAQYKQIQEFIDTNHEQSLLRPASSTEPILSGYYMTAFCSGLDEILQSYTNKIDDIETLVIKSPNTTLPQIHAELIQFRSIFSPILGIIGRIQTQEFSSCMFISIIQDEYDQEVQVQNFILPIVPWLNRVLHEQIIQWVTFGELYGGKEFFIQATPIESDEPDDDNDINVEDHSQPFAVLNLFGLSKLKEKENQRKINRKTFVNYSILPSNIPVPLAERILFLGNSIVILEKSAKAKATMIKKQQSFFEILSKLPTDTFNTDDLSEAIEKVALVIGQDLHTILFEEGKLLKHVSIIKDFMLGGRGELFHTFLLRILHITQNGQQVHMLNQSTIEKAFEYSAHSVHLEEELEQLVHIIAPKGFPKDKSRTIENYIAGITLSIPCKWPLHLLITKEVETKYNEIFGFLLQIRLVQMKLNDLWVQGKNIFQFPFQNGPLSILNHMLNFFNNFQHYLQADVLESQYNELIHSLENSKTFDDIVKAHTTFQTNIFAQTFQTLPRVRENIERIISISHDFYEHLSNQFNIYNAVEGVEKKHVDGADDFYRGLFKELNRTMELINYTFRSLSKSPTVGPYLGQLLLRLDYNQYFSTNNMFIE